MHWVKREVIEKGWSSDRKYCVTDEAGKRYLLRISPLQRLHERQQLFSLLRETAKLGVPMCAPIELEVTDEGVSQYLTWIDGEDAETVVPHLPKEEQYAYGIRAGEILKRIHSVHAPADQPDWEARFGQRIQRKIQAYKNCPVQFDGAQDLIRYLETHTDCLKNRPQSFQHGDYHIGNMMIEKGALVVIDFDRWDYGDPWEEFNRIVWSAQKCPDFARGTVDGYFNGTPPKEFWELTALYIASNSLSSVAWAANYGEGEVRQREIRTMLNQVRDVLDWYDSMKTTVPSWYTQA